METFQADMLKSSFFMSVFNAGFGVRDISSYATISESCFSSLIPIGLRTPDSGGLYKDQRACFSYDYMADTWDNNSSVAVKRNYY